ncbi:alpha/beta hydrolase [Paraburkholderia ferrariae]|uniref:alpha/beta hydrolase n=1 Tax=Paraburkholderia ferrariae TaxID=386056 RepID=UPI0005A7ED60|nr:alpha/beta hydrolase [Paraburkholderia ferrariae]
MTPTVLQQTAATTLIDKAYDARHSVSAEAFADAMQQYTQRSAQSRAALRCHLDICYDEASGQTLDILASPGLRDQPVLLFIHGGYWRMLSKEESAFMADALARSGIATVTINYALAPAVTLEEIIGQVRQALVWLARNASHYGLDARRIVVSGSSAGGHLAATLLDDAYRVATALPAEVPCGALLVSGLYDMQPIRESFVNEWLGLDDSRAEAVSPIGMLPRKPVPLAIVWGEHEPTGFKEQAKRYESRCRAQWGEEADVAVSAFEVPGRHHFDVVLDLCDPSSALTHALFTLLKISG